MANNHMPTHSRVIWNKSQVFPNVVLDDTGMRDMEGSSDGDREHRCKAKEATASHWTVPFRPQTGLSIRETPVLHSAKGEPSPGILSCFQRSTDLSVIPYKMCPLLSCSGEEGGRVAGTATLKMLPWGQAGGITHRVTDGLITDGLISALLIFSQRPFNPSPDKW